MFRLAIVYVVLSLLDLTLTLMLLAYRSEWVYELNPIAATSPGPEGIIAHKLLWVNVVLAIVSLIVFLGSRTLRWQGKCHRAKLVLWVAIAIVGATTLYSASLFYFLPANQTP